MNLKRGAPLALAKRILPRRVKSVLRSALRIGEHDSGLGDREQFVVKAMEAYVQQNPDDEAGRNSLSFDKVRLVRSIEWLSKLDLRNKQILEIGGYGLASYVIREFFPKNKYMQTDFDLRSKFPYPDDCFDLILNMEVIEHICDIQYAHGTSLSGARQCLEECLRVLKPRGKMFLTTPNASSVWIIQRVLLHQPPWLYEYHFREFTLEELRSLLEDAGFRVVGAGTEKVWHFWNFDPILEFMRANGYSLEDRGDDIFVLAEKPITTER